MNEAGVKGYEAYTFNLILGPAGMPKTVVDTLDQASRKMMADPDMVKFLNGVAAAPTPDTSPERTVEVHPGRDRQVGAGHQGRRASGSNSPPTPSAPASRARRGGD